MGAMRMWLCGLLALPALLAIGSAQAAPGLGAPVAAASLDRVRGGFGTADSGLWLAIGVQRSVGIDGQIVATSTVSARIDGSAAATSPVGGDPVLLVQSGRGNSFDPAALRNTTAALVVQNTLDGRRIDATTAVDVSTNSLQLLRGAALQSALSDAVAASLRR